MLETLRAMVKPMQAADNRIVAQASRLRQGM